MKTAWTLGQALLAASLLLAPWCVGAQDLRAQMLLPPELEPVSFSSEVKDSIGTFTSVANTVFKKKG